MIRTLITFLDKYYVELRKAICITLIALFRSYWLTLTNHKYIVLVVSLCIIILVSCHYVPYVYTAVATFLWLTLIVYIMLYTWRHLSISVPSYLAFLGNVLFLSLYILGFINLIKGLPNPIYLENLSTFSYYRYMLFLSVALMGICIYFFLKLEIIPHSWGSKLYFFTFPYLKEEIRVLLYSWNDTFFGPICCSIMDHIHSSKVFRSVFVFCLFCLIYCIRLIQALLFFNFVFFHEDLRYCIYLLPISFISWILSFFEYYLKTFLEGTCNYIRDILSVSLKEPLDQDIGHHVLFRTKEQLNYSISSFGVEKGFQEEDIDNLINEWLLCGSLTVLYNKYCYWLSYYTYFILFLRLISWSSISHTFIAASFGEDWVKAY